MLPVASILVSTRTCNHCVDFWTVVHHDETCGYGWPSVGEVDGEGTRAMEFTVYVPVAGVWVKSATTSPLIVTVSIWVKVPLPSNSVIATPTCLHHPVPVPQQLPQIAILRTRHPDLRKVIFQH
jgi:hypothetical protein